MTTLSTMSLPSPEELAAETSRFYAEVADSFSATRDHPWPGWQRAMREALSAMAKTLVTINSENFFAYSLIEPSSPGPVERFVNGEFAESATEPVVSADSRITVVDFACGNMRFEDWLQPAHAICIDNCEQLVPEGREFINCDLLKEIPDAKADLAVCFGFMHHIPTHEQREALLAQMAKSKVAIVTFWQFLNSEKIAAKAELIEGNDYWLHWQDRSDIKRYCHNYTDTEIAGLMAPYEILAEFQEDGRNHNLNHYVVFCRKDN